ncbi:hypothetical protein [Pelagicoccus sp. SDUM812002]|uniref:hypothetical protein n=1 Tax=Pelagicoccus sp. SDUM812002 TaxID=3041266 RepID=UPI0028109B09|nr:hypothetical protein [Pelagicoccus sp. SDUM812002]MDQ8188586.1 hypothetical protein [Pelagicoccus sp. SDUM812002]
MNKPTLITAITIISALYPEALAGEKIEGSISLLYMSGSGSPDAPYSGIADSKDYNGLVPRLSISYLFNDRIELFASYTELGKLETNWIGSQQPPIIGEPGREVITPFEVEEEMKSIGFGFAYNPEIGNGILRFGIGSENIKNDHNGWLNKKEKDWSLSAFIGYKFLINDSISLSADYLQLNPPGKTLHLAGGSFKWKF